MSSGSIECLYEKFPVIGWAQLPFEGAYMVFIKMFDKAVRRLNKVGEVLMVLSITIMFVMLLAQVSARFVFYIPLPSSQDIIIYFLVGTVFMGIGNAAAADKMIAIDIVAHFLPEKPKQAILIFADAVSVVFAGVLVSQGIYMMEKTRGAVVGASPFTQDLYYLIIVLGSIILGLTYFNSILQRIVILKNSSEVEA